MSRLKFKNQWVSSDIYSPTNNAAAVSILSVLLKEKDKAGRKAVLVLVVLVRCR